MIRDKQGKIKTTAETTAAPAYGLMLKTNDERDTRNPPRMDQCASSSEQAYSAHLAELMRS
jgi:hypothetical protein